MSSATAYSMLAPAYRKVLKTRRPVILYFFNKHCPACEWAGPVFREIAEAYKDLAVIYMLDTASSPCHAAVKGTPTVLFYLNGMLLKKLKGIGTEETLKQDFVEHIGNFKAPLPRRKRPHDVAWLCRTFRTLRTIPDARRRSFC